MRGERLIKANRIAQRTFKYYNGFNPRNKKQPRFWFKLTESEINRFVGIYRKTKVPCSCTACGNPRKHFGFRTRCEIKQIQAAEEELKEIRNSPKKHKFMQDW
jgi:hypothetical protein